MEVQEKYITAELCIRLFWPMFRQQAVFKIVYILGMCMWLAYGIIFHALVGLLGLIYTSLFVEDQSVTLIVSVD